MGPALAIEVFSLEGSQRRKQITLMHTIGTSDVSVHRELWELPGEEPPLTAQGKSRQANPHACV